MGKRYGSGKMEMVGLNVISPY